MLAKTSLILTLIVSLLFATQASWVTSPVEMTTGGACASMQCTSGCCTNKACCKITEQQKAPPASAPTLHFSPVQLATLDLRIWTALFYPPAPRRFAVILDDARITHSLPPRTVSCIQLI